MKSCTLFFLIFIPAITALVLFAAGVGVAVSSSNPNSYCPWKATGSISSNRYAAGTYRFVKDCSSVGTPLLVPNIYAAGDVFCYDSLANNCFPTNGEAGRFWLAGTIISILISAIGIGFGIFILVILMK